MTARPTTSEVEFLRREWDDRARTAPLDADYYRSGDGDVERDIVPHIAARGTVLDIGCGAGRMTRALSRVFERVYAVDISAGMVSLARTALQDLPHVRVFQNDGLSLGMIREPVDLAIAIGVFPHLAAEWIENYARAVWQLLRPGGAFVFEIPAEFASCLEGYETVRREGAGRPYDLLWCVRAGRRD